MSAFEIAVVAAVAAYLIGSISTAILVCRLMRLPDPRTQGSQNPGATNVLRVGGKTAAALTLLGDSLKGALPVWVAMACGLETNVVALVAMAAFLGHLFPVFFNFRGGKGVATLLGCLFVLSWPTGVAWIMTWFVMLVFFRYVSLASLGASLLTPIYIGYFSENLSYLTAVLFMVTALVYRHRSNIQRLFEGKENKVERKKKIR